ncbi:MAG: Uma2 family endonuclease [Planctomycetaceae bacterium]
MSTESPLIAGDDAPPLLKSLCMTEEEFGNWHDEFLRGEWVDGEVELMAPANTEHSEIQNLLLWLIQGFTSHHNLGKAWGPELTVKLPSLRRRRVPDLLFVSQDRQEIIRPTYVDGAPDLIMEVVSPDSVRRDWRTKYQEYEQAGVLEYWIIDPGSRVVEAYVLTDGAYQLLPEAEGRIASQVVSGFFLKPAWLWQSPRPKLLDLLRELGVLT